METCVNTTTWETKEQMGRWHKKWHEEIEKKGIELAASRIIIRGNNILRMPKHSEIEVVEPEDEEGEEIVARSLVPGASNYNGRPDQKDSFN